MGGIARPMYEHNPLGVASHSPGAEGRRLERGRSPGAQVYRERVWDPAPGAPVGSEGQPPLGDKTQSGPRGRKSRAGTRAGSRAVLFLRNSPSSLCTSWRQSAEAGRLHLEPGLAPRTAARVEPGNGGLSSTERGALVPSFLGQRRGGSPVSWSCEWESPTGHSSGHPGRGRSGLQSGGGVGMGVRACTPAGSGMRDKKRTHGARSC